MQVSAQCAELVDAEDLRWKSSHWKAWGVCDGVPGLELELVLVLVQVQERAELRVWALPRLSPGLVQARAPVEEILHAERGAHPTP